MKLRYIGAEVECIPQLGGIRVQNGFSTIIHNERIAAELIATARWEDVEQAEKDKLRIAKAAEQATRKAARRKTQRKGDDSD